MKAYKTSKDYKRLKELLDAGYVILSFDGIRADTMLKAGLYFINGRTLPWSIDSEAKFIDACNLLGIEYIEPTIPL